MFNILLQLLDDGRLTDNKGRTVDFKNTIIIMTSNLGSHLIQERMSDFNENNLEEILGDLRIKLSEMLRQTIRPEFLNRIDEVVLFRPLLKKELSDIIDLQLQILSQTLSEKNIKLEIENDVKEFLLSIGYNINYGARPLKRTIQKYLINPLSTELLINKINTGDTIRIVYPGAGKLEFEKV